MKVLDVFAWIFVLIGGITWGTVGFFSWNFIDFFLTGTYVDIVIYDIVGISAIWLIIRSKHFFCKSSCKKQG